MSDYDINSRIKEERSFLGVVSIIIVVVSVLIGVILDSDLEPCDGKKCSQPSDPIINVVLSGTERIEKRLKSINDTLEKSVKASKSEREIVLKVEEDLRLASLITAFEKHLFRSYVTENQARLFVAEHVACGSESQFDVSEFILFDRDNTELSCQEIDKIKRFMNKPGQISGFTVFGFASPDGREGRNKGLAEKRAKVVMEEITNRYSACPHPDCRIKPIGEDHPINGIANSRSVVIAACRAAPGQAETADNPDTTPPSCPAPD